MSPRRRKKSKKSNNGSSAFLWIFLILVIGGLGYVVYKYAPRNEPVEPPAPPPVVVEEPEPEPEPDYTPVPGKPLPPIVYNEPREMTLREVQNDRSVWPRDLQLKIHTKTILKEYYDGDRCVGEAELLPGMTVKMVDFSRDGYLRVSVFNRIVYIPPENTNIVRVVHERRVTRAREAYTNAKRARGDPLDTPWAQ